MRAEPQEQSMRHTYTTVEPKKHSQADNVSVTESSDTAPMGESKAGVTRHNLHKR